MIRPLSAISLGLLMSCLTSCGEDSNFNQLWVSKQQEGAIDELLARAQYHYDKGEFDDALEFADQAYKINNGNEDVGIILGYIYLSKGGIDTFQLTDRLMDQTESKEKTNNGDKNNTADTLADLADVIGLNSNEIDLLGTRSESAVATFSELPVYEPKLAADARAAKAPTVSYFNKAISYVCPFVSTEVIVEGEDRHTNCGKAPGARKQSAKAHFLWSFAHLGEAIAFNSLLLYRSEGQTVANLVGRAEKLQNDQALKNDLPEYAVAAAELATVADKIFPTSNEQASGSMLTGLFNDLTAVTKGFSKLTGIPDRITGSITKAVTQLQQRRDQLGGATVQNNATAIREQFTKKLSQRMAAGFGDGEGKISKDQLNQSPEDKAKICSAYNTISGGQVLDQCK